MNGRSLAGVVPAEGWFDDGARFRSGKMRNQSLLRMFEAFLDAVEGEMPGEEVEEEVLRFEEKTKGIWINLEGEARRLEGVSEIKVRKTGEKIRVIAV